MFRRLSARLTGVSIAPTNKGIPQGAVEEIDSPETPAKPSLTESQKALAIRQAIPSEGLFAGHEWRISPAPFPLGPVVTSELESLGRVLLQFYRSVNLLYRKSAEGKQPEWVARWLDLGKPADLIQLQRQAAFKNELPRVIRPDLLLTEHGISVTE